MIEVTVDSLKDFQTCHLLYDYRHLQKLPEPSLIRDTMSQKFEDTLKNIINFFFYKKQGDFIPSYSSILNRWEKLWFPKNTTSYDIITEQHESYYGNIASLTSKAASALLDFHNIYEKDAGIPIAIDEPFIIPINSKIKLNGSFDLILSNNGTIYVYKWMFNMRSSHEALYQIDFAALYKAFDFKYKSKINSVKFGYYDILSPNQQFVEYTIEEEDLRSLSYWCSQLSETDFFPPRRGLTAYCKKCPFDKPCSKWKNWKE